MRGIDRGDDGDVGTGDPGQFRKLARVIYAEFQNAIAGVAGNRARLNGKPQRLFKLPTEAPATPCSDNTALKASLTPFFRPTRSRRRSSLRSGRAPRDPGRRVPGKYR